MQPCCVRPLGTMPRVFVRELARHHCLRPRHSSSSRSVSTVADGVPKGRRKRAGFALAAVSIVGGTYYAMTRVPQPSPLPPAQAVPPTAPALAIQPPSSPLAPPEVSARVELLQRMDSLQSELEALRKQKRDQLIDMKKQAIKEDIQTIRSGLAALEKQAS